MYLISKGKNYYKKVPIQVKAAFWFLICSVLQKGISIITTPIFTRLLSSTEYGQYNIFNSWLGIISIIITFGIYNGVYTQGLVKFEDDRPKFISTIQSLCLFLIIMWSIVYFLFSDFWNNLFSLTTVQMMAMLFIIWTNSIFQFWATNQRVNFQYKHLVIVTLLASILTPIVSILFVINAKDKVTARILGIALVNLLVYTVFFIIDIKKGKKIFSKKYWKYILVFNIPLIPHYLSSTILNSSDRIMIGKMIGEAEAGIYSLAYSISQLMTIFSNALRSTIEPWIYQKIKNSKLNEINKVAYPSFFIIAAVNIFLILLAPEIIAIFAPKAYYDAIWIIPPVAMSTFFTFLYTYFASFEFYYEKTIYVTIATMCGAIVNIILNFIFIKIFGYYAAGYTTLVCYIIYTFAHYHFMKKICQTAGIKNPYNGKTIVKFSILFLLIGFILLLTYNHLIVRYSLILLAIITMLIFKNQIKNLIQKFIHLKKYK